MGHYLTWEEDQANREGKRDASYGRHRSYDYDCHFGGDVDRAYCEGYSEEERRQQREREEREEEERERDRQARYEHERYLQAQYEQECYEQQMFEQQQYEYEQQQLEQDQNECHSDEKSVFSAMQEGTDGG